MTESLLAKFIIFAALVVVLMPLLLVCVLHTIAVTLVFTGMGRKAFERHYQTTEEELLAWTEELLDNL
jgi:hypothetical protein